MNGKLIQKKEDLLRTAKDLFWKFGFRRVTVEEICREANVSKMTFYKYFSNKEDLAIEMIKKMFDENMKVFNEMMEADIPFEEKMHKQVQMKMEGTKNISEEFVKDIYGDVESEINKYWKKRINEAMMEVMNHYKKAQEKGWIRKDLKIDFMMYLVNKFFEFTNDDYLISKYDTMQDLIMEINKFFLYGILPSNKPQNE